MLRSKAFTLVELMVTVGIIVLTASLALPNLAGFKKRQSLERTALEFRNKLLEAQTFSLAPRRPDVDVFGYAFGFAPATGQYGIAKVSSRPRSTITNLANDPEVLTLPSGVSFGSPQASAGPWLANSAGIFEIDFLIGSRAKAEALSGSDFLKSGTVTIPLTKDDNCVGVKVSLESGSVIIDKCPA
ncbi:prepilin-type N-terminal cleavage/methylation domain-containing protein [Candidatus Berkelbacteria bacterium]|nr:prepilin-type N-terminal cleavage/methylation domain-containing protein [Candidatus Berkelbacteria bacterium]